MYCSHFSAFVCFICASRAASALHCPSFLPISPPQGVIHFHFLPTAGITHYSAQTDVHTICVCGCVWGETCEADCANAVSYYVWDWLSVWATVIMASECVKRVYDLNSLCLAHFQTWCSFSVFCFYCVSRLFLIVLNISCLLISQTNC